MRTWLLHPILFYPLVALVAALVVAFSVEPQKWPRAVAAVAPSRGAAGSILVESESLGAPAPDAAQTMMVVRDFLGRARALRIAVLQSQGPPGPADRGVRILLAPSVAGSLAGRPATVAVTYNPLPVNAATGLAISIEGAGPNEWVSQTAPPQHGTLRFELPARTGVDAIGLRALSTNTDQHEAYGLEITSISITPHPSTILAH